MGVVAFDSGRSGRQFASARQFKILATAVAIFRTISSALSSTPAALKKSVTVSSTSISLSSQEPTAAWVLQSWLRVASNAEPSLPVGKSSEMSLDGSSALSIIKSQWSRIFDSHHLTTLRPSSTPEIRAISKKSLLGCRLATRVNPKETPKPIGGGPWKEIVRKRCRKHRPKQPERRRNRKQKLKQHKKALILFYSQNT